MIDLDTLLQKHPGFTIRSQPASCCKNCKGAGEYLSRAGIWRPCLCVCMEGDEEIRAIAAEALHQKVPKALRGSHDVD
jgi:hypothetical protein